MKNAQIVAKFPIDVKQEVRLLFCTGTSVPATQYPGVRVIRPKENEAIAFTSPLPCSLYAVLVNVDRDGNLQPYQDTFGSVIHLGETQAEALSEGHLWIAKENCGHVHAGEVLQRYNKNSSLLYAIERNQKMNPWANQYGRPDILAAKFQCGVTSADRAMSHAAEDELNDIAFFTMLASFKSNDALEHALNEDLRHVVSLQEHQENIAELERLAAASSGEIADQIRKLLLPMRNPEDIDGRYNAYRMVLMVRAVQRRATTVANHKHDSVAAIVASRIATATYISDVAKVCSRITSVLEDEKPWWAGSADEKSVAKALRLQRRFVKALRDYATLLLQIRANPFRPWAERANKAIYGMAEGISSQQFEHIHRDTDNARHALEAIRLQVLASRAISALQPESDKDPADKVFADTLIWSSSAWNVESIRKSLNMDKMLNLVSNSASGRRTKNVSEKLRALQRLELELLDIGAETVR